MAWRSGCPITTPQRVGDCITAINMEALADHPLSHPPRCVQCRERSHCNHCNHRNHHTSLAPEITIAMVAMVAMENHGQRSKTLRLADEAVSPSGSLCLVDGCSLAKVTSLALAFENLLIVLIVAES